MMRMARLWIIITYLGILSACQSGGRVTVSEDLVGVWKTDAPTYADRFFEIKTSEIVFATGENTSDTYPISKVKIEQDWKERRTVHVICYKNTAGQEYKFSFYYDPASQATIRFKNQQEMVWTKRNPSAASD